MGIQLVDMSPGDFAQVKELVSAGRFSSAEEFLQTAIRNQLLLERQGAPAVRSSDAAPPASDPSRWSVVSLPSNNPVEAPELAAPRGPLFGQFYRFLPLKFVLRFVATQTATALVDLRAIEDEVGVEGAKLAAALRGAEQGDVALSTGFPSDDRDSRKSRDRFTAQYLGRPTSSGAVGGFGVVLGLLGSKPAREKDAVQVALTKAGLQFVRLRNPVLDDGQKVPLSVDEISFLWELISKRLPDERDHMREAVRAIRSGANTPTELAGSLSKFYKKRFSDEDWSEAKVNLTRSGAVSRLSEMSVVKPEKSGSRVTYEVNDEVAKKLGI